MSGICGVCNFDGQPADRDLLKRMTSAIAHRGPDRLEHWGHETVAFGHCALQTTPESVYETQPLVDEARNLCLTMDGRIDNRNEIIARLESKGVNLRDDTDAELVLRSYQLWGSECPERLIGDFSFAIWDNSRRQLFCARDVAGNRPFLYHWNGRRLIFSSELHALFEDPSTPRGTNEAMVAEYLAARVTHKEETLYKDILRLPPAHSLTVKNGLATKRRYWDIDSAKEVRYRSDDEYAEHFREVLKESVRCRLRSHGRVGAYLSGGLDSSSIVSVISLIHKEEGAPNAAFETFSNIYPGLPCDESHYIQAVVEHWDLRANYMDPPEPSLGLLRGQAAFYKDICDYPNGTQADSLRALAQQKGFRVLLTGDYGDERLGGSLYYLADFVRQGNSVALYREMRKQDILPMNWRGFSALLHYAVLPTLPEGLRRVLRFARRAFAPPAGALEWIDKGFAQRTNISDRLSMNSGQTIRSARTWLRLQLEDGGQLHGTEIEDRAAARFGIEQRHPFTDRRMIELSFGLPEDQRLRKNQKFVLRQAMRGLLPELVRRRQDKAEFSETLFRAVRRITASTDHKLWCEKLGWIDGNRFRTMQREMERLHSIGDRTYMRLVWPLWMVCALNLWLDDRQSRTYERIEEGFEVERATA